VRQDKAGTGAGQGLGVWEGGFQGQQPRPALSAKELTNKAFISGTTFFLPSTSSFLRFHFFFFSFLLSFSLLLYTLFTLLPLASHSAHPFVIIPPLSSSLRISFPTTSEIPFQQKEAILQEI
jgi:hypothetical protein